MEISPISIARIAPMVRSKQPDLGLTDVFEIERSSRSDDETYTPGGDQAASGSDDDEMMAEDEEEFEAGAGAVAESRDGSEDETREISIFA